MKVKGLDKRQGTVTIELTQPEDCWVLTHLIDENDLVKARTIRKIKKGGEEDRKATIIKRPMTLTIEVEKTELAEGSIRILGVIRDGPEDVPRGTFHTIALEEGQWCELRKPSGFKAHHLARLDQAQAPPPDQVLLVVHDREQAIIALLSNGYRVLTQLKGDVQKKDQDQKSEDFYKRLTKTIQEYKERIQAKTVIIASPAFFKEDLLKSFPAELKKGAILATCSSVTRNGIEEILKRDEVKTAIAKDRVARQFALVEQVQQQIATDGKVAYGTDEVERAAHAGAIEKLMVTEARIKKEKEQGTFDRLDNIMMVADQAKAELVLIDSASEPGKKVDGLSGIVALLRYRLE